MANEYRILNGTGVGMTPTEQHNGVAPANFSAGAALTLAATSVVAFVYKATVTKSQLLKALEHIRLRINEQVGKS